jgi:hypothetical protein
MAILYRKNRAKGGTVRKVVETGTPFFDSFLSLQYNLILWLKNVLKNVVRCAGIPRWFGKKCALVQRDNMEILRN